MMHCSISEIKKLFNWGFDVVRTCLLGLIKFLFDILVGVFVGLRRLMEEVVAILTVIVKPIITDSFKVLVERVLTYGLISWGGFILLSKLQKLLN